MERLIQLFVFFTPARQLPPDARRANLSSALELSSAAVGEMVLTNGDESTRPPASPGMSKAAFFPQTQYARCASSFGGARCTIGACVSHGTAEMPSAAMTSILRRRQ